MSKIFIVNAAKSFGHSQGKLNDYLTEIARETLTASGHDIRTTRIDNGYNPQAEVENILWADAVIYQFPAWWMEAPWIMKKYVDEVFTAGHGKLYESDGRTRSDARKKYGSGGLLQGKKYMFSVTWNAPAEAFTEPGQFFEGKGIDGDLLPFHKANQFLGMSPLPTFMCNDVIKQPSIENDVTRYKAHLQKTFAN